MRNTLLKQLPIAFAFMAASLVSAQKSTTTDVTTIIYDANGVNELLTRSDDYNGTGHATYTSLNGVTSMIDARGSWQLLLNSQSVRTIYLTPNNAVGTQPAGPPAGLYWKNVEVYTQCYDQYLNMVPMQNVVNTSGTCSFGVDFYAVGTKYKLVMTPHLPANGPAP